MGIEIRIFFKVLENAVIGIEKSFKEEFFGIRLNLVEESATVETQYVKHPTPKMTCPATKYVLDFE